MARVCGMASAVNAQNLTHEERVRVGGEEGVILSAFISCIADDSKAEKEEW